MSLLYDLLSFHLYLILKIKSCKYIRAMIGAGRFFDFVITPSSGLVKVWRIKGPQLSSFWENVKESTGIMEEPLVQGRFLDQQFEFWES